MLRRGLACFAHWPYNRAINQARLISANRFSLMKVLVLFYCRLRLAWIRAYLLYCRNLAMLEIKAFFSSLLLVSCCSRFLHLVLVTQQTSIVLDALVSSVIIARALQNAPSPAEILWWILPHAVFSACHPACCAVCILLTFLLLSLVLNA